VRGGSKQQRGRRGDEPRKKKKELRCTVGRQLTTPSNPKRGREVTSVTGIEFKSSQRKSSVTFSAAGKAFLGLRLLGRSQGRCPRWRRNYFYKETDGENREAHAKGKCSRSEFCLRDSSTMLCNGKGTGVTLGTTSEGQNIGCCLSIRSVQGDGQSEDQG